MSAWEEIKGSSPIAAAESNDCAVVALAAACRVPYDDAWVALDKAGRKPGRGTKWKSSNSSRSATHPATRAF